MFRILIGLLICSCLSAVRAGDDEVHFKPKAYAPRENLRDRSYSGSAYSQKTTAASVGTRINVSEKGRWSIFSRKSPALADKKLSDSQVEKGEAYKQQKNISVPTITADPAIAADRRPFDDAGKKAADADYKASGASREKNPLLKPRQGIKETE